MQKLNPAAAVSSQSSTENSQKSAARKTLILQRQRILFSSYRLDQYDDPESYMASLGMVFEGYSDEVICYVTAPQTGIQRRVKWPPTISEIVEACDAHVEHLAKMERFKNWGSGNKLLEPPRENRPTLAEMKEKYGDNWGLTPQEPRAKAVPAPTWDQISEIYSSDPARMARLMNIADVHREASTPADLLNSRATGAQQGVSEYQE